MNEPDFKLSVRLDYFEPPDYHGCLYSEGYDEDTIKSSIATLIPYFASEFENCVVIEALRLVRMGNDITQDQIIKELNVFEFKEQVEKLRAKMKKKTLSKISDEELLSMATAFRVGPEPLLNGRPFWWEYFEDDLNRHSMTVQNMGNPDKKEPDRWAIMGTFGAINKLGEWEYQRMPSSRDDKFYKRCRYTSVHEAILYYRRWRKAIEDFAVKRFALAGFDVTKKLPIEDYKKVIINYDEVPKKLLKF